MRKIGITIIMIMIMIMIMIIINRNLNSAEYKESQSAFRNKKIWYISIHQKYKHDKTAQN